jgi:hypothetical protein
VKDQAWLEITAELGFPIMARVLLRQQRGGKVFGGLILADQIDFAGVDGANDDQVWEAVLTLRRRLKVHGTTFTGRRLDQVMTGGGLCINRAELTGAEDDQPVSTPAPPARPEHMVPAWALPLVIKDYKP